VAYRSATLEKMPKEGGGGDAMLSLPDTAGPALGLCPSARKGGKDI
jgi:hypothetical protein